MKMDVNGVGLVSGSQISKAVKRLGFSKSLGTAFNARSLPTGSSAACTRQERLWQTAFRVCLYTAYTDARGTSRARLFLETKSTRAERSVQVCCSVLLLGSINAHENVIPWDHPQPSQLNEASHIISSKHNLFLYPSDIIRFGRKRRVGCHQSLDASTCEVLQTFHSKMCIYGKR